MKVTKKYVGKNIVNKNKLIYIPVIIALLAMLTVGVTSFNISKNLLLKEATRNGYNLANQVIKQIEGSQDAVDAIDKMLEQQIRRAGQMVIKNEKLLNNDFLKEFAKDVEVDEIHWLDNHGETLYSTVEAYRDWTPPKGHPLYNFLNNNNKELMEDIRPDEKFKIPIKYGAIKNEQGYFVQVGILAKNIKKITDKWNYQSLVENIANEEGISYITIVDTNFNIIADTDKEKVGLRYIEKSTANLIEIFNEHVNVKNLYCEDNQKKLLELTVPIVIKNEINGALILGISMKSVYESIFSIFRISFGIAILMFLIFLWFQNKNVIKPVNQLNYNIDKIDIENNIVYRLPVEDNDTFYGLADSINKLLDKLYTYIYEIKDYQEEIEISNEELVVAYQQITAAEEELRAQYDEIQDYTKKLEDLKRKYEIAIEVANSAVWEIDVDAGTIYFSKEFENIIGECFIKEEKIETVFKKIFNQSDEKKLMDAVLKCEKAEKAELYIQVNIKDKDNNIRWMLMRGKGIYDENKNLKIINGIFLDITALKEQEEHIHHLAYNDHLTKLPNRRSFLNKLKKSIFENQFGAVMLLDLDNFKEINDTLGHSYGDMVLKLVSEKLLNLEDDKFFVSRFGGDEFLVLISDESDRSSIEEYAIQISNIFKDKFIIDGNEIYIGCSIGITRYPFESNDVNQLIMNADTAMYKVKDIGKNDYMFFEKGMTDELKEQVKIEKFLRSAILNDDFKLVYQPQVCIDTAEIVGFEALLRLKKSNISPAIFIPVAENNGMIVEIGRWVTKEVIKQISIWQKNGINIKPVAINFSAKQLNDSSYMDFLIQNLNEYKVDGKHIEIEITESIFLNKKEETILFLNKLRKLGVKIALDDFGTGYSSISYLTFLPVDKIKLDKSLCDEFLEIENIAVMDNIIALAHSLNLEVLAEGIEDLDQYNRLRIGKCNQIQGYLFSKPIEVEALEKVYNENFLNYLDNLKQENKKQKNN